MKIVYLLMSGNWAGEEINLVNYKKYICTPEFKTPEEVLFYLMNEIAINSGFNLKVNCPSIELTNQLF